MRRFLTVLTLVALVAAVDAAAAPQKPRADVVRTLDAITIEGEIAVPQVLFITSRDTRRFRDDLASTYRPTALDVLRSARTPMRSRILTTDDTPRRAHR